MMSKQLNWTKQRPREAGYYWYRQTRDFHSAVILRICEEEFGPNVDLFVRHGDGPDDTNFIENYPGEWAGPIPTP